MCSVHQLRGLLGLVRDDGGEDRLVLVRVLHLPAGRGAAAREELPADVERPQALEHPDELLVARRPRELDVELSARVVREPRRRGHELRGDDLLEHLHVLRGRALGREPGEAGLEDPPELEPFEHRVEPERRDEEARGSP